jgi:hypothetical protein
MSVLAEQRRALVQGDGSYWLRDGDPRRAGTHVPGTVSWEEHLEAFEVYAKRYGRDQSAERIDERGGFGYLEIVEFLGHAPKTWAPR